MRLASPADTSITEAIELLRSGGVIVHATETCYGLACDLSNPKAVEKLFTIKKRPSTQPVSGLFPTVEEAKKWVAWNDKAEELAASHLPGPLTLILPLRKDAPSTLFPMPNGGQTLGVRVSSHPLANRLATLFGGVLSTTSANVHGEANPYDAGGIFKRFEREGARPDLILDSGMLPPVPPSTVIDLATGDVKRQGDARPV